MLRHARSIPGILLLALTLGLLCSCSLFDSEEVQMVKNGKLGRCPGKTVGKMVDDFMGSPSWESGVSTDGQEFVNIGGNIMYFDKEVHAVIQFVIDKRQGTFQYQAMEFNGIPQTNLLAMAVLDKMCAE